MNIDKEQSLRPPSISAAQIIRKAEEITEKYARSIPPEIALLGLNFDVIYERIIYPEYEISLIEDEDLGFDSVGEKILGRFDPVTNTAFVDPLLRVSNRDPRRVFTCWHEVGGHGILQGDWLRRELARLRRLSALETTTNSLDMHTSNLIERQANIFAAHAAAPTWMVNYQIRRCFGFENHSRLRYAGPGQYFFCHPANTINRTVNCFDDFCREIAKCILPFFGGLSIEALGYRVAESRLVLNQSSEGLYLHRTAAKPSQTRAIDRPRRRVQARRTQKSLAFT